jgi:predicted nucleic acid-binding protein
MRAYVVDASVAVKWLVSEDLSEVAVSLLERGASLMAPDLIHAEVANALWAAARRGNLTPADVDEALASFARAPIAVPSPLRGLIPMAFRLATDLDHPVYDCIYLALALQQGHPLVTADERFLRAVAGHHHLSALVLDLRKVSPLH